MERRIFRLGGRAMLIAAFVMHGIGGHAQDGPPEVPDAQDAIAALELRLAAADSTQDRASAALARMELAGLLKPHQGLKLAQEAAALLDGDTTLPELALRAHKDLAERYTALRSLEKAAHEWAEVARLSEDLRSTAVDAVEQAVFINAVSRERIDSLTTAMAVERASSKNALVDLAAERDRREQLAKYALIGGVAFMLLAFVLFGLHIRGQRAAMRALRQDIEWLKVAGRKGVEPTVVASSSAPVTPVKPELPEVVAPAPVPTAPEPFTSDDEVLLALVRRRGAERLLTLREARQRGDHEKVVRVVHSLKPQLVSLDAPYFTELCGRLVSMDPQLDPQRWSADLDRFEAGIARVIGPSA